MTVIKRTMNRFSVCCVPATKGNKIKRRIAIPEITNPFLLYPTHHLRLKIK